MGAFLLVALEQEREHAADSAFADHNFGTDFTPTDSDSWTRDGVYWSRWVYGDVKDDGENEGRERLSFGVEFKPDTAEIVDKWTS